MEGSDIEGEGRQGGVGCKADCCTGKVLVLVSDTVDEID